jgi:hypothetical protein
MTIQKATLSSRDMRLLNAISSYKAATLGGRQAYLRLARRVPGAAAREPALPLVEYAPQDPEWRPGRYVGHTRATGRLIPHGEEQNSLSQSQAEEEREYLAHAHTSPQLVATARNQGHSRPARPPAWMAQLCRQPRGHWVSQDKAVPVLGALRGQ